MPDRDNSYNGSGSDEASANSYVICRDFLRNVCKRGKRCRFRHPDINEVTNLGVSKNEFIFCHDFQNKECVRINCRFIHGTKEDEDCYKKTVDQRKYSYAPWYLPMRRREASVDLFKEKAEAQAALKTAETEEKARKKL